jgi:hypothetical protein
VHLHFDDASLQRDGDEPLSSGSRNLQFSRDLLLGVTGDIFIERAVRNDLFSSFHRETTSQQARSRGENDHRFSPKITPKTEVFSSTIPGLTVANPGRRQRQFPDPLSHFGRTQVSVGEILARRVNNPRNDQTAKVEHETVGKAHDRHIRFFNAALASKL